MFVFVTGPDVKSGIYIYLRGWGLEEWGRGGASLFDLSSAWDQLYQGRFNKIKCSFYFKYDLLSWYDISPPYILDFLKACVTILNT